MNPDRRPFAQRLQRSPPMAWDLEYQPSDDEPGPCSTDMEDLSDSQFSSDVPMADDSTGLCLSPTPPDQSPGFSLTLDSSMVSLLGEAMGEAECLAKNLLRLGRASERLLQQHFELLPSKPHARNSFASSCSHSESCSINLGAFVHGGILGCHKLTLTHPWSCLLWTTVVRSVSMEHCFTSLTITPISPTW